MRLLANYTIRAVLYRPALRLLCALPGLAALTPAAAAETIQIVTEELPPYNFTEHGKLDGFSTEVVQAVLSELHLQGSFLSLPWARAYDTAKNSANVLIYSIARTPERENSFKWVGRIAPSDYFLFSLRGNKLSLVTLDEAKKYQIGTVNEDVGEQYLLARGFMKGANLQSSAKYEFNYEKLKLGRIDLAVLNELAAYHLAKKAGDDPEKVLLKSYHFPELGRDGFYMAFGARTPDSLVQRFKSGLDAVKKNGKYEAIRKKWL